MDIWGLTDVGLVRKDNQDTYRITEKEVTGHSLAVVCDGMGGIRGGKLASNIAADVFMREVTDKLREGMGPEQIRELSSYATTLANRAIRAKAEEEPEYHGMGTTLVAAVSYEEGVVVSNVGDSRAYHLGAEGIRRVSKDHSLVERLVDSGDITAEQARSHPKRNYITRALGPEESTLCDGFIVPMKKGEYILLCSDGLVETVSDEEMLRAVCDSASPEAGLERMLEIAKSNGAPDNVTVVLLRMA